jgi:hypothetical protein
MPSSTSFHLCLGCCALFERCSQEIFALSVSNDGLQQPGALLTVARFARHFDECARS